jgi:hypothetical protein
VEKVDGAEQNPHHYKWLIGTDLEGLRMSGEGTEVKMDRPEQNHL